MDEIPQGFAAAEIVFDRHSFAVWCDDHAVPWHLVTVGAGIGFSQVQVGSAQTLVKHLLPELVIHPLSVLLTVHAGLRTNLRVRCGFDFLAERLAQLERI